MKSLSNVLPKEVVFSLSILITSSVLFAQDRLVGTGTLGGGSVFAINEDGGDPEKWVDFSFGSNPNSDPIVSNGKIWGTASGGPFEAGIIFSINPDGSDYQVEFVFDGSNGFGPVGNLLKHNGKFLGVTRYGGANRKGVIYSIDTSGANFKKLHDFDGDLGRSPLGGVVQHADRIYGITRNGGQIDKGVIYSINVDGSDFVVLNEFDTLKGLLPRGRLLVYDGKLYGAALIGGSYNAGTVYKINLDGSHFTKLHDFGHALPGYSPRGSHLYSAGKIWGAAISGVIYSINTDNGNYQLVHRFESEGGRRPESSVLVEMDGKLWGTTSVGGEFGSGIIFNIDPQTSEFTKMADLNNAAITSSLIKYDNKLWGYNVGNSSKGALFSLQLDGTGFEEVHDFKNLKGNSPSGSLLIHQSRIWGMTGLGGSHDVGTIFSLGKDGGGFRKEHDFDGVNGANPVGGLLYHDGRFWGLAYSGGDFDQGVIFSVNTNGSGYSRIHDFNGEDGTWPYGNLLESNGRFWGTTHAGGDFGYGVIFSISTDGSDFLKHYDFDGVNGSYPYAHVVESNNKLWGMTSRGGETGNGIIFSLNTDGQGFNKILDFDETNGREPWGNLIEHNNKLWGMTRRGGTHDNGTIFSMELDGTEFTKIYDFEEIDGRWPDGDLIVYDGKLYGVTRLGGEKNRGVIFSLGIDDGVYSKILDLSGEIAGDPFLATLLVIEVAKQNQVISFEEILGKTFGDDPFELLGTSSAGLELTYSSSDEDVVTVDGSIATIVGAGTVTIAASQVGNDDYLAAENVIRELTVEKATQQITFESLPNLTYGDDAYELLATSSAQLEVSYASSNEEVVTISGNVATIVGAGVTTISAIQEGDQNNFSAEPVIQDLVVNRGNQEIIFETLSDKTFGDDSFALMGSSSSGLELTYSSSDENVLTVDGSIVTIVGAGIATITASQEGDYNFNPAEPVIQELMVNRDEQEITFETLSNMTFGDESFELIGSSSSGLEISYLSSDKDLVAISGSTATIVGAGLVTIKASQEGDDNFNPAEPVIQELMVNRAEQEITFETLSDMIFGDTSFALMGSSSSSLVITYSSSDENVLTVDGSIATIVGAGTAAITASQDGNDDYLAAENVTREFTVEKATQQITFESLPNLTYGNDAHELLATSSAGLEVSYGSSAEDVVAISGSTAVIVGAGTATITASQEGDDNFNPAEPVIQELEVTRAVQEIIFEIMPERIFGSDPFELLSTSSSGLEVSYSSSNEDLVAISGSTAKIVGAGIVTINASQNGNDNYFAAETVTRELIINKAYQEITFVSSASRTYGDDSFELQGSVNSGLPITYTSSNENVAQISDNLVEIVGAGVTTISASQEGDDNFNPAETVTHELVVDKADQEISFDNIPPQILGSAPFLLTGTSSSGLEITYVSSDEKVATVSEDMLTIVGEGTSTITAKQSGNSNFKPANPVSRLLTVQEVLSINGEKTPLVYPNPVDKWLRINVNKEVTVTLLDMSGKTVIRQKVSENQNVVNVGGLQSGIYILHLSNSLEEVFGSYKISVK